jgi:uncharacterized protein YggE
MPLAALLLIAAGMALGETPQVVRATGEAVLSIQPDQTWLKISVAATAGSAGRAAARNADRTARVIACARDIAGPTARIHSANYTLTRRFDGFVAADTVEIRLSDSRAAGRLIDAVAKLGSEVRGVEFTSADEESARSEALKRATVLARERAGAIAAALGLRAVRVLSAEPLAVAAPAAAALPRTAGKRKASVETSVIAGPIEIRAQVVVTVEVAP